MASKEAAREADAQKLNQLYHRISLKFNLTKPEIIAVIESQYLFIREKIEALDIRDVDEEGFEECKTNFALRHLGKLHTSYSFINWKRGIFNKHKKKKDE